MPGLPTMDGAQARGKGLWARGTPLLLLLLLWGATATALALESGPVSRDSVHMQKVAEIQTDSLARWPEWTSQSSTGDGSRGRTREAAKRQEGAPLQQPPRRDKTRCKNFFWKTFSSCK